MKMIIITGKGGSIVGTALQPERSKPEAGSGGPVAGPDQKIHVIDVPKELEGIKDASELHRKLKSHFDAGSRK